jgi:hypothetical protein
MDNLEYLPCLANDECDGFCDECLKKLLDSDMEE